MKKNIDTYVQSIIHDNEQYIIDGGYESIADYLIHTSENGNGFYDFFDDSETEDNLGEPTEEQIDEVRDYLTDNYDYLPAGVDGDGKIYRLSSVKPYKDNMEVSFLNEHHESDGINITWDNFRDEEDRPVKEYLAREVLDERYNIIGAAADKVIDEMFTFEWIINDDDVYLYLIKTIEACQMGEKGTKWMTHVPSDTPYYKFEEVDRKTEQLPAGFTYDEVSEIFADGKHPAELVTENDGSVSLVSSERIVKWF